MENWFDRHGIGKDLRRNFIVAIFTLLVTATSVLAVRLDRCQTECNANTLAIVERLKDDRIKDLQAMQTLWGEHEALKRRALELEKTIRELEKKLRGK